MAVAIRSHAAVRGACLFAGIVFLGAAVEPDRPHSDGTKPAAGSTDQVVYAFRGSPDGAFPRGGLIADAAGNLFATTSAGGTGPCSTQGSGCGTVVELMPGTKKYTERVLYSFQSGSDGAFAYGRLAADGSGALYGSTVYGGSGSCAVSGYSGCGIVFKLAPSGSNYTETVLYRFKGGRDGAEPNGTLLVDGSGALYGTTEFGGGGPCTGSGSVGGCGTVFKLTPARNGYTKKTLYAFRSGSDGTFPDAGLLANSAGVLYGTLIYGGSGTCSSSGFTGCGAIFQLAPSGAKYKEKLAYSFQGGPGGQFPSGTLITDSSGALYGVTEGGGSGPSNGNGIVFKLALNGKRFVETVLHTFGGFPNDAGVPFEGLTTGAGGALYGTTVFGGSGLCTTSEFGCGATYKLTPTSSGYTETLTHSFGTRRGDGEFPFGGLAIGKGGELFGTTLTDTGRGFGVVFSVAP